MHPTTALLLLAVAFPIPASGADIGEATPIKVGDEEYQKIELSGSIQQGDAARLENMRSDEESTIVALAGDGGDFQEALAIAAVLNDEYVMTIVEDGASCFDACALAFLGGSIGSEEGDNLARSISPNAKLGFSAPRLDLADGTQTKVAVDESYARALKTIGDFVRVSADYHLSAGAAGDLLAPANQPYIIGNAYRLAHVGVELQDIAPPSALTLSMARNLCQAGWKPGEGKLDTPTDTVIAKLNWKAADATFVARSDYFGEGLPVRRTVIPFDFAGDDTDSGYKFCLVDQAKDAAVLQVACRGFLYADTLAGAMERARSFDNPDEGTYGEADTDCDLPTVKEPLAAADSTAENRWALVPGSTPLDKIAETLAGYAANEPPL